MSHQRSLFDTSIPEWELDAAEEHLVAAVLFSRGVAGPFDYLVPAQFADSARSEQRLEVGRRVRVPFGRANRTVMGYCVEIGHRRVDASRLKSVAAVVDPLPLLSGKMLELTRWIADYYLCDWGQVLEAVVPSGVRRQVGTRQIVVLKPAEMTAPDAAEIANALSAKQAVVWAVARQHPGGMTAAELAAATGCSQAPIKALQKKGWLLAETRRTTLDSDLPPPPPRETPRQLNPPQQAALVAIVSALEASRHECLLLHGVTGSGKTEVYMQAIEEVVSYGRQAIVLVPEISLTPQTVKRFRARFDRVAVLHSHLADRERHQQWLAIGRGEIQVVVGARSAIFSPTPYLGLIVLDEEHENSFKQDSAPRYHAREVALQRGRREQIPVVLGSATPSLESLYAAQQGQHTLLELPTRVAGRPLPDVTTVDLREQIETSRGAISRPLYQSMRAALADGGQVLLLLNRRGYSTYIQCPACGMALRCPFCDVPLTFHRDGNTVLCHYCDHRQHPPTCCPDCRFQGIRFGGLGTQRLEGEVRARFPDHRCLRMDTDTMRKAGSHDAALEQFRRGEAEILLGTQMIAKGLDFPQVTLVGVINADSALHWPDFRAAERTFQLVAQVAGRTGRGAAGGRVVVQTYAPDHPAIVYASRHDACGFAAVELPIREQFAYPPYGTMIRIVVRGEREAIARAVAQELADAIRLGLDSASGFRVLGPAPAPLAKLQGKFRFQIHVHGTCRDAIRAAVNRCLQGQQSPADVFLAVDVDPIDML